MVNHNYAILMDLHVLQAQTYNREIIFFTTLCKVSFYNVYFKGRLKNRIKLIELSSAFWKDYSQNKVTLIICVRVNQFWWNGKVNRLLKFQTKSNSASFFSFLFYETQDLTKRCVIYLALRILKLGLPHQHLVL